MLSRTADHLFWMARYMERAENTARLLDVNLQNLLLPQDAEESELDDAAPGPDEAGWRATLRISELEPAFNARHARATKAHVLDFMVRDPDNASSIYCCLSAARENARAVRGTLTTELWETVNSTWLDFPRILDLLERDPAHLFEWVKVRSHLSRGVSFGTLFQDEAFYFTRLGVFLERADNTARILDVRFHEAAAKPDADSSHPTDFYYWAAVLRSVSGFEIYRKVYRDVITPERVVELLMLNPHMPRSMLSSLQGVCENLETISNGHSGECERYAGKLHAELKYTDIQQIQQQGLHKVLTEFLERVNLLGNKISQTFLISA
ncbi:alpha-E domain-containing protein [Pandoraea terrae]|uniref:Alpha-E domain-containing protein n=1 Tax=Pandoraea terrae TaxID=1537710 RepID=A0A5E4SJ78_9BURK|nr:alpha-E domain-containing protein [Pandoraea terrae]VVD75063.1 alpha-E domain-containing protein [Pandoraea terrae]